MTDSGRKNAPDVAVETDIASGFHFVDPQNGGVIPPIQPATTYARDSDYRLINPEHSYSRDENPGYGIVERMLARLEHGADAMLFSSGMAAAMAVVQTLSPGDHIVAPKVMYWGLRGWLTHFCKQWNIDLDLFDASDDDGLAASLKHGRTRLVWIETPSNPTWQIIDIQRAADLAHDAGARLVVDSTAATPVLTRPLELGADLVMHSATKYLNGHGDVVAGALVTAADDDAWQALREVRGHGGAICGPFEAWLLQRGMRTLFLRVHRSSQSALLLAERFSKHPALREVLYPGLRTHPGHAVAAAQMTGGFGGMLSLRVRGGAAAALAVAGRCRVFVRATSLGGTESLIEHRHSIEGASSPIPDDLLRLSIGIECPEDLVADLDQALSAC